MYQDTDKLDGKICIEKTLLDGNLIFMKKQYKPDGYGGFKKTSSIGFWEREDYDDGSFLVRQGYLTKSDKIIRFGPLTATLNDLNEMGFILTIESFIHLKKHYLKLKRDKEEYNLAMLSTEDLMRYHDLTLHVKDQSKPYYKQLNETSKPKIIIEEVIKEIRIETDPFEELMLRYPTPKKYVKYVGNQTIEEYVKQQLKENRKLNNVE